MLNIRIRKKRLQALNSSLVDLPTPINITVWWNFGSLLGAILIIQILTGLFLAMHYTADVALAFSSVRHIIRDVNGGWFLRTLHANGASFFFICIYAHVGRGLYYGRYSYKLTWILGVFLLLLVIMASFLGYVLPWGQMSFWGATVITNLFRAIPYIGDSLVAWLWGGYSVDNATLTRFFTFHFLVPIIISFFVLLHIIALHDTGRNNPLGLSSSADKVPFHWYFSAKDIVGLVVMLSALLFVVFFNPYYLGEPDNFVVASPLNTPYHIVPEWYFLFAYAILRSIPNKLGGVVGLFCSLLILLSLPFLHNNTIKGNTYYPLNKILHWVLVISFLILTVGGAWPVEEPYVKTCRLFAVTYFSFYCFHYPRRILIDKAII